MFKKTIYHFFLTILIITFGLCASASAATKIKLGHFGPGPDPFSKSLELFAKMLNERSNGSMKVQIFPAGQLGNEKQQLSALQGGLQEMLITSSTNLTNMNVKLKLLDWPLAFSPHPTSFIREVASG